MKKILLPLMMILLVLTACSTGRNAYQKGDYKKAVNEAVERLRRTPNNKKAQMTLKDGYADFLNYYQAKINDTKRSSDPNRWETAMNLYVDLNTLANEIQRCPAANRLVHAQSFRAEYEEMRRNASEAQFQMGMNDLNAADRPHAKTAYFHFKRASELQTERRDAQEQMARAKEMAMVRVLVKPVGIHSQMYSISNDFFESQVMNFLKNANFGEFVEFYSERDGLKYADNVMEMNFDDFMVGQTYIKEDNFERKRDNVIVGTNIIKKDSIVNVYGTVSAKVKTFQKTITSSGLLDMKLKDGRTGAVEMHRKFTGTFVWEDRWGMFVGDERALMDSDKCFVNHTPSPNPAPQALFIEFTKPIYAQLTDCVTSYYRNF
jgi:hypothetical protein